MSRHARLWLGWLAVLGMLAGCTGIPSTSAPQVVRTVERSPGPDASQPHIAPQPGESPGDVVDGFMQAGVDAGAGHSTARQFLTTKAANAWKDNQTVILADVNIGEATISGRSAQVQVTGRRVGQLDASGIFSATLKGMGKGDEESFAFPLEEGSDGVWRIDQPPPGVLIKSSDFNSAYRQRTLYFTDPSQNNIVVPDLRYSSLNGQALASWLLAELIAGPRPELTQTVVTELPDQVGKPSVQIGTPTLVDLPGTAQLDVSSHNALATELAFTLDQVDEVQLNGGQLELIDSGKPVRIPQAGGVQFSAANFCSASRAPIAPLTAYCPTGSESGPYFVQYGAVLQLNDKGDIVPLGDRLGQPGRNFGSVAVRQGSGSLQVAGLVGSTQLQVGSDQSLIPIRLPQPATSRPEWQPFSDNVWVGAGSRIYRATAGGPVLPVSLTSQLGALPAGPITAVRLSSDGDRVALVIQGPAGIRSVWIGSVITSGSDVRVDSLEPITPPALAVTDVAWADSIRLDLVAAEPGAAARMWTVYSDGYSDGLQLVKFSNKGLPGPPTAIGAAPGQPAVVSVGNGSSGTIWQGTGNSWISLSGSDVPVPGANPVYAS